MLAALVLFTAVTLIALEGSEVVVLRTYDAAGGGHDTRTWAADQLGAIWIEAANPDRVFLQRVRAQPRVALLRGGEWRRCTAELAGASGHARIRRLLGKKYGWRDRWIGLLVDTSRSVAVRLACD